MARTIDRRPDGLYRIALPGDRSATLSWDEAWSLLDDLRTVLGEDLGKLARERTGNGGKQR
jgi:hypothetical protein